MTLSTKSFCFKFHIFYFVCDSVKTNFRVFRFQVTIKLFLKNHTHLPMDLSHWLKNLFYLSVNYSSLALPYINLVFHHQVVQKIYKNFDRYLHIFPA